jgi:hypothetical protein
MFASFFMDVAIPRFGEALSRSRSDFLLRHRRAAKRHLKDSQKTVNKLDTRPRINRAWVTGADLQPIFEFLSSR